GEVAGCTEPRDPGADDGDPPATRRRSPDVGATLPPLGRHPFQRPDADGCIDILAPARVFTRARADLAEAAGEQVVVPVHRIGIVVAAIGDQGHVAGDIGLGGTGPLAGDVVLEPAQVAGRDRIAWTLASSMCRD